MPPPKRPFITSSLTSTLKSTIANQPLLSNLTNIDKLSSQASSFAQKSPFFANLTNQQQHSQAAGAHPQQDAHQLSGNSTNNSNQNQPANGSVSGLNMMRAGNSGGPAFANQPAGRAQAAALPAASTPTVDMSHLTEEERLMIQSVMAKAEMADMGMPVDTSAPSSTNLPSNASQALVQQHAQARQQQQQARVGQNNPIRQPQQQQQQAANQRPMVADGQPGQSFASQLQQHQQNMMFASNQPEPSNYGQQMIAQGDQQQQQFNQAQQFQQQQPQQQHIYQNVQRSAGPLEQQQQLGGQMQSTSMVDPATRANLPSLEQQTQQLVSQINSQFNLNQPSQIQQQRQQQQPVVVGGSHQASLAQQFNPQQHQTPAEQQISHDRLHSQQVPAQQQQQGLARLADGNLVAADQSMFQNVASLNQPQQQMIQAQQQQQPSFSVIDRQQQQQLPSQQLMNTLPNESVGMMQQMTNQQAAQVDQFNQQQQQQDGSNLMLANKSQQFSASNQSNMIQQAPANIQYNGAQMAGFVNQQQSQLNNGMKLNQETPLGVYNLNQQQPMIQQFQAAEMLASQQGVQFNAGSSKQLPSTDVSQQAASNQLNNQMLLHQPSVYSARDSPYSQHDPRDDIRFGGRQQVAFEADYYNDHALSDEEHLSRDRQLSRRQLSQQQSGRPPIRRYDSADQPSSSARHSSRDKYGSKRKDTTTSKVDSRRDRDLQAYDLAQYSSAGGRQTKARQLPQPTNQKLPLHSSNEHLSSTTEHKNKISQKAHQIVRPTSQRQGSPYLSASDDEEALEEDELEEAEEEAETGSVEGRRKKQVSSDKASTARASSSNSGGKNDTVDKSEEALRLLSELKLTEQATQVMEQQQLLIKQGQELIKLQLEQQALSQELKKSLNKPSSEANNGTSTMNEKERDGESLKEQPESQTEEAGYQKGTRLRDLDEQTKPKKLTSSICNQQNQDSDEDSLRAFRSQPATKTRELPNQNIDDGLETEITRTTTSKRQMTSDEDKFKRKAPNSGAPQATFAVSARYNRDLLQSPTDTTDSDIEPLTQASLRRQQQQRLLAAQTKPKGALAGRRREPTGLPPSPLPVAAAIQLHQMQQQHFKAASRVGVSGAGVSSTTTSRANFMRSRSVTSSPNHHLDHINSGYLTDSQRIQSASPDTLSEFGGQRRRKRLPEPPTNLVPITPSMVRKMIQAQRAGGGPARLPTSVNAQTTLLTNTHSTRSGAFERPIPAEGNLNPTGSRAAAPNQASSYLSLLTQRESHFSQPDLHPTTTGPSTSTQHGAYMDHLVSSNPSQQVTAGNATLAKSDLNKFLSSTYGNSILKNSNISDVKETPELDKLISNLDEYYDLDNGSKRTVRLALDQPPVSSQLAAHNSYSRQDPSTLSLASGGQPSSSYLQQHGTGYSARSTANIQLGESEMSALTRCYSADGEDGSHLASRLSSKRPYTDYAGSRFGRPRDQLPTFSAASYPNGPSGSSYLLGRSSPLDQPTTGSGIRFGDRANTTSRFRDSYQMSSNNSNWRLASSSYYTRPTAQAYSSTNRLPLTSTGSLDLGGSDLHTDYLGNEQRSSYGHLSDFPPATGQKSYSQSRYSAIDPIRDRYRDRYSGNGSPSRYGRSDYNAPDSSRVPQTR